MDAIGACFPWNRCDSLARLESRNAAMHTSASIIQLVSESSLTEVMRRLEQIHDDWLAQSEALEGDGKLEALRSADVVGELLGALIRVDREALDAQLAKADDAWIDAQTDYGEACETASAATEDVLANLETLDAMVHNPPNLAIGFLIKLPEWRIAGRRTIRRTSINEVDAFISKQSVPDDEWFDFVSETLPAAIARDLKHHAKLRASQGRVVERNRHGEHISQVRDGLRLAFYKRYDAFLDSSEIEAFEGAITALKQQREHLLAIEGHTKAAVANNLLRDLPVWPFVDQFWPAFAGLRKQGLLAESNAAATSES
jgi:hypothetical protein